MAGEEKEELGPLPAGRHGFSREQVAHNQRERLIAGLAQTVAERGYNDVTIADITKAATVSRRTFYEHFESKEECFLAAFDIVVEYVHALIAEAIEPIPDWPHKIAAGLRALVQFFTAQPDLARLCTVDSVTAGPVVAERFRDVNLSFVPLLRPGREERSSPRPLPDTTEESIIGSLASLFSRSMFAGEAASLEPMLPDLIAFVLIPYLGPEEAKRIAAEPS